MSDEAEKRVQEFLEGCGWCPTVPDLAEYTRQAEARGAERAYKAATGIVFKACHPSNGELFGEIDDELRAAAIADREAAR